MRGLSVPLRSIIRLFAPLTRFPRGTVFAVLAAVVTGAVVGGAGAHFAVDFSAARLTSAVATRIAIVRDPGALEVTPVPVVIVAAARLCPVALLPVTQAF